MLVLCRRCQKIRNSIRTEKKFVRSCQSENRICCKRQVYKNHSVWLGAIKNKRAEEQKNPKSRSTKTTKK